MPSKKTTIKKPKAKKPAAKKRTEFQSAFRKARSEGKKNFTFKGKKYNTKLRK